MTTTLKQAQPKTAKDDIYAEETMMTSIVSYPKRCHLWGNARFRGNCDGRLFKNLVLRYRPTCVADPMMGSGTTRDVIAGLNHTGRHNIHYWGADLRTGFDLRTDPLPGPFDFIWLHPPYWNIVRYSDDDPRDLSTCRTYEEFSYVLCRCLRRCYESLLPLLRISSSPRSTYNSHRRRSPKGRVLSDRPRRIGQLRSIVIKAQHNCTSNAKTYGHMEDVPIQHEYCCVIFKKP